MSKPTYEELEKRVKELEESEEALLKSEENYCSVVEDLPVLLCSFNKNLVILFANDAYCKYFRKRRDELIGLTFLDLIPEENREAVKESITSLSLENPIQSHEHPVIRKNGEKRWQKWTNRAIFNDNGELTVYQSFGEDITERIQAEEELSNVHEKLSRFMESATEGFVLYNSDLDLEMINDASLKILNRKTEDVIGKNLLELSSNLKGSERYDRYKNVLKTGKPFSIEDSVVLPNIGEKYLRINAFKVGSGLGFTFSDITERKVAERERDHFFETSIDMICKIGFDSKFMQVNPAWENILGWSEKELVGKPFVDFIHPDDLEITEFISRKHRSSGESLVSFKNRVRCRDGSYKWLSWNATPEPALQFSFAIARDVTDQKLSEKELLKTRDMLERTGRMAKVGGWEKNLKTGEDNWSEVTREIHEVESDFVPTMQNGIEFYKEGESREKIIEVVTHTVKTGEPFDVELQIVTAKGNERWIRALGYAEFEGGEAIRLYGTFQDICNRKQAENALHERQRLNELLMDSLPHAAMIINRNRVVIAANKLALDVGAKIGDYCWKEFGKSEYLSEENKRRAAKAPNTKGIKCTFCLADQCSDSSEPANDPEVFAFERLWDTYWVPINEDIYLHYSIDVTERKQLEEQLQIRQRMDSLGTLAGGIAHDFNNLLTGIMGNISMLSMHDDNLTNDQKRYLSGADKSTERAADLIRQFQTLSNGAVAPDSLIDIYDISKEVFSLLEETTNRLIDKQIRFKKGDFLINAVPAEIHQILLNLGINSLEAIEERGARDGDYIRIESEDYKSGIGDRTGLTEGDYIHITFADTGMGMPDEIIKQAFDPLFTTKDKYNKKGQGLGLAMVYNIVTRKCNGHIYIDSSEGKGTTFHMFLPKAQPEVIAESKTVTDIEGGTETILVVDDEQIVIELTQKILTDIGYTVLTAGDGKEALRIYKKQKDSIDTVILDITMPQMSGKKLFQELLDINPDVMVIISSGQGDKYSKEGIFVEAKGNIGKPYKMKTLAETVRSVLDS